MRQVKTVLICGTRASLSGFAQALEEQGYAPVFANLTKTARSKNLAAGAQTVVVRAAQASGKTLRQAEALQKSARRPVLIISGGKNKFCVTPCGPRTTAAREIQKIAEKCLCGQDARAGHLESGAWLTAILMSIGDAVIAVDRAGKIKFMNAVAEKMLGSSDEECLGAGLDDVVKIREEKTGKKLENPVFRAMSDRLVIKAPQDILLAGAGGQPIYVACRATPIILPEGGNASGAVLAMWDVTQAKRAQEALKKAHDELEIRVEERTAELGRANRSLQEEVAERKKTEEKLAKAYSELQETHMRLIQSEKMAALGRFSSGIAHEIKNPLGIIIGGIEYLMIKDLVSALFTDDEFLNAHSPDELAAAIKRDGYVPQDKLPTGGGAGALNAVISMPDFYDYWQSAHKSQQLKREAAELVQLTAPFRKMAPAELLPAELVAIQFSNRLLLEATYPQLCPKNAGFDSFSAMQKVKDATMRADTIVKNLLKLARPSELKTERVKPEEIIEYAVSNIPVRETSHVLISRSYAPGLYVEGDRNQLVQVMINIIANAAQAIPKKTKGEIKIRTYATQMPELLYGKQICVIEVEDNGLGIKSDDMKRLFEPFFTTKVYNKNIASKTRHQAEAVAGQETQVQGTGLGLSVSKTIVNNHKGELVVVSSEGKGTVVKVLLPAVE